MDVKRENGQFKVELLVSGKLFTLQLHLLNTGGRGGSFPLQTAKRSECCHGDRSQGIVFPRVFLMKVEGFLLVFAEISTSCDPQE